jgi:hypothetical protein
MHLLDRAREEFQHRPLGLNRTYLVLNGPWPKDRPTFPPQKSLLLGAYMIKLNGRRQTLASTQSNDESHAGL